MSQSAVSSLTAGKPLSAVVCGATFGQLYADAIAKKSSAYALAGIVGRGSRSTTRLANQYKVPVLALEDLSPESADLACVVVRSNLLGGQGSVIARHCLGLGIDVVQEHPVHYRELADTFKIANANRARYYQNMFYEHLHPVAEMLSKARESVLGNRLHHIEISVPYQLGYSAINIFSLIAGGRLTVHGHDEITQSSTSNALLKSGVNFKRVAGMLSEQISWGLRVDMQMDPADPDDHMHMLLRCELIEKTGTYLLADVQGPLIWLPKPYVPKNGAHAHDQPPKIVVSAETCDFATSVSQSWPEGIDRLLNKVLKGRTTSWWKGEAQRQLAVARDWSGIARLLGLPIHS